MSSGGGGVKLASKYTFRYRLCLQEKLIYNLYVSTFVAIGHLYASYSVVVLGFIYCERDGSDSVIVLGYMYCTSDVS